MMTNGPSLRRGASRGNLLAADRVQDGPAWGALLVVLYLALALLPLGLAYALEPATEDPFLVEVGKGAGLLGFALLALQVALSARLRVVDAPFGLDVVMRFHRGMAIFAGALLLSHPFLLAAGGEGWEIFGLGAGWQVNLGKLALALLVLVILGALLSGKLGVQYQLWRRAHRAAVLVVAGGFVHGLAIGPDLEHPGMKAYWWLLLGMVVVIFTFRNVYVPLWGRRCFRVAGVEQETHDTFTVRLEPEDGRPLPHRPGQFMWLKLQRPGRPSEEHPFTISSSPTREPPLTATIKKSGDFTNTIDQTRPGDTAGIEGPYGRFSFLHQEPASFVFIAGGVGITPILSMLEYLQDTGDERPVVLIYGNKAEGDIIRREELDGLPGNVRVVHVLSHPDAAWTGPSGYVTKDVIRQHAGEMLEAAHVYVCGPPVMMGMLIRGLRELGVPDARIIYERFAV
jgi:predicted ferric reductase